MENRVKELEMSVVSLAKDIKDIKRYLVNGFTIIESNFKKIEADLKDLNSKVNSIDGRLNKLGGNTSKSLKKVDGKLDNLKTEIQNINRVTGADHMISNMKIVSRKK